LHETKRLETTTTVLFHHRGFDPSRTQTIISRMVPNRRKDVMIDDDDDHSHTTFRKPEEVKSATTSSETYTPVGSTKISTTKNSGLVDPLAPKRPFSAYNLFFKVERQRLLDTSDDSIINTEDDKDTSRDVQYTIADCERAVQNAVRLHHLTITNPELHRRKHRKSHGKISFTDLARKIARTWKQLTPENRQVFVQYVQVNEKARYEKEMSEWTGNRSKSLPSISGRSNNYDDKMLMTEEPKEENADDEEDNDSTTLGDSFSSPSDEARNKSNSSSYKILTQRKIGSGEQCGNSSSITNDEKSLTMDSIQAQRDKKREFRQQQHIDNLRRSLHLQQLRQKQQQPQHSVSKAKHGPSSPVTDTSSTFESSSTKMRADDIDVSHCKSYSPAYHPNQSLNSGYGSTGACVGLGDRLPRNLDDLHRRAMSRSGTHRNTLGSNRIVLPPGYLSSVNRDHERRLMESLYHQQQLRTNPFLASMISYPSTLHRVHPESLKHLYDEHSQPSSSTSQAKRHQKRQTEFKNSKHHLNHIEPGQQTQTGHKTPEQVQQHSQHHSQQMPPSGMEDIFSTMQPEQRAMVEAAMKFGGMVLYFPPPPTSTTTTTPITTPTTPDIINEEDCA
jgi:HMG (high mobility group) box